jgi:hypothetical protein
MILAGVSISCGACFAQAPQGVPGESKTPKTTALEAGAKLLQSSTPLKPFDMHLSGFHPMKDHPEQQMEAHHFCHQMNEDFAQCTLFDSSGANARLNGIEYIISEKLFATLPGPERAFWHPHNGEILSGQLVAPGIPAPAEKALMRKKINSYGKTWHVWNTGHEGSAPDQLPLGPAKLAWSFSREGEAIPAMVERRDRRMGISTAELRRQRAELQKLAKPQAGVDELKGKFARPTKDLPGVLAAPSEQR